MSNWALELQALDTVRIWIRGEANILGDAPSRAPWEHEMAQHLPIPEWPVRDLVRMTHQDPDALEDLMLQRKEVLLGDVGWAPLVANDEVRGPAAEPGYETPKFGRDVEVDEPVFAMLGRGAALNDFGPVWPKIPAFVCQAVSLARVGVGVEETRPISLYVGVVAGSIV